MRVAVLIILLLGCTSVPPSFETWKKPSGTEYDFKRSLAICEKHCTTLTLQARNECLEECMREAGWVPRC